MALLSASFKPYQRRTITDGRLHKRDIVDMIEHNVPSQHGHISRFRLETENVAPCAYQIGQCQGIETNIRTDVVNHGTWFN